MSDTTLTHKDLAASLGVSETTIKSYRRKFPGCIPVANKGKPIRFTHEAATVALRIRDYFETGMSVEDVRARLAAEFDWIDAEAPEQASDPGRAGAAPALTKNVSNMARGMVSLTQQQNAILHRMDTLESLLADLGVQGLSDDTAKRAAAKNEAERKRGAEIEARLDQLDNNTKELAQTVASLTQRLDRFLDTRDRAAEEWREKSAETLATAARLAAETINPPQEEPQGPSPDLSPDAENGAATDAPDSHAEDATDGAAEQNTAHQPPAATETPAPQEGERARVISFQDSIRPQSELIPSQPEAQAGPTEPPRHFFSLPLMVCTEDGHYMSAGGKSRGRFSLNDLKAMLIYGFTPPDHFSLRWERHGQGWWLHLEQDTTDRKYRLLLMELPSHKGGTVAEILQLKSGDTGMHPVEIWGIIDSFAE